MASEWSSIIFVSHWMLMTFAQCSKIYECFPSMLSDDDHQSNPLMQEMKKSVERTRNRWKLIVVFLMLNTTSNNVLYPSSFIRIIQVLCVSLNIATSAIVCSNKYIFLSSHTHKLCKNIQRNGRSIDRQKTREFYSSLLSAQWRRKIIKSHHVSLPFQAAITNLLNYHLI